MSVFAQLPFELKLKIFSHCEDPARILVLNKTVFDKLGPPYYRSITFHFRSGPEEVISHFLKSATQVCLSNVTTMHVDISGTMPSFATVRMFLDTIDMIARLPALKGLHISAFWLPIVVWKVDQGRNWEYIYDAKSGNTTRLWENVKLQKMMEAADYVARKLQEVCSDWRIEDYMKLGFNYGDIYSRDRHDEVVDLGISALYGLASHGSSAVRQG